METWKTPENIIFWLFVILCIFLLLLFFIINLIKISYKKAAEKKWAIYNEKLIAEDKLKKAIIQVQDQERKEIASELHDQISNKLNLVLLNLNNIENNKEQTINCIREDLKKIIQKNRDISHYLFPVEIENIGILLTLQDISLKYTTVDFKIDIVCNQQISFKDKITEIQIYRVIQESLTNTLKYSNATLFRVVFRATENHLLILISDNGQGFDLNQVVKGIGLTGIETRLKSIGADFKIKSKPNAGTRLMISL